MAFHPYLYFGGTCRQVEALAEGGEVRVPLAETFWAPRFGACVDRFGSPWMISTEVPSGS